MGSRSGGVQIHGGNGLIKVYRAEKYFRNAKNCAIGESEIQRLVNARNLRGIMHRRSIIENNINQTRASGVNGASSGMRFSIPALVFPCIAGGFLDIAFIIPLRDRLRPSGLLPGATGSARSWSWP